MLVFKVDFTDTVVFRIKGIRKCFVQIIFQIKLLNAQVHVLLLANAFVLY